MKLAKYVHGSEYARISPGLEYALTYMNMSTCARVLNMSKSAEIYPNVGKYDQHV